MTMVPPQPSANVPRLQAFTLGDWLVEPKPCQVSRGETVIKLRPQLIDVLVCLARRAGKIVLKDELLKEVWPGQYIAESGLSRCVAELRQVLQDDAQQPRYIETVMKRGYRLVAPVVWLPAQDGVAVEPAFQAMESAHAVQEAENVGPDVKGSAEAADPIGSGEARGRKRRAPDRRTAWLAAAAVLLLAAGTATVVLVTRTPPRILTERDTVLLADVRNVTGDRVFDDTLRLALAVNLEQAPFLRILPLDVVRDAVVRTGRSPDDRVVGPLALDVCRREGATVVLAGSIALLGSRYAIGIEAIACDSGEAIARTLVEADGKDHVLGALDQAATRIREKLGESHDSLRQHAVPLERATTPSLDALKALSLGDYNRDHAHLAEALMLYRQATDLDPGFALAWARLGAVARNLGLREEAEPAFRRAFALRGHVSQPERFYIESHYYRRVEGNSEKAIEIYRAWKRMYPGSVVPPNNLSTLLSAIGRYDEALAEGREAVRLAPGSSLAHGALVRALLGAGRIPEARRAIAEAVNRGADDLLVHRTLLNMALLDGDGAAIQREINWASRDPMTALVASRLRAAAAMSSGRLREGRQLWSQTLAIASGIGPGGRVAETQLYQAEAEALVGNPQAARTSVEAALAVDAQPVTMTTSAIVFALAGDRARASRILDDIGRQAASPSEPLVLSLPCALALVEAMGGRATNALENPQRLNCFGPESDYTLAPLGVSALIELRAGRPASAAAAFRTLIQIRAIEPASPWVAFARLALARAIRETGDNAGSIAAYDAFLESWKEADPDAPLLAVARRERAAVGQR